MAGWPNGINGEHKSVFLIQKVGGVKKPASADAPCFRGLAATGLTAQ